VKILFFSENFPPETNAAATRVYERALYWVKAGHNVTVITSAPNFPLGVVFTGYKNHWYFNEKIYGINVVRVKTYISPNQGIFRRGLDFLSFGIMSSLFGLFQVRPDVVAATSPQFFAAIAGWFVAFIRRIPFVFELGDLWPTSIVAVGAIKRGFLINLFERIELFLYRNSTRVAALTYAFKENLVDRGINANKIDVVRNGVDVSRYRPMEQCVRLANKYNIKNNFVVGYVGTHGMAHGLSNVLKVAEKLKHEKNIVFLFVGAGADRENLVKLSSDHNLPNTLFLPMQPKQEMRSIWSLCDIALVHLKNNPAFSEVIPSKIFEAMSMGLPILLNMPDGEARNIIEKEYAGIWVPPENPEALSKSIKMLIEDKKLHKKMSQNCVAAAPKYSRSRQAQKMLDVFNKAML
jgi:colanic acid biosynthesis glycosyl transferase WcaI